MAAAGPESEMQADLAAQRAACERQIAAGRDPSAWAAFRAGLHSAHSGAHQTFSRKGTLLVSTTVCPDASPLPISSPPMMSVDSSSRNDADQSHSQSKNKKKALPAKRRASALSAASPGSVRRSHAFRETCESSEEADPDPGTLSPD